jgi:RNA-directed DNA polymerase
MAAMSLTTPNQIRTLQRKLYAKAEPEPAFRFDALYDKVSRADILSHAYDRVRSNRGAPGIDGVTVAAIEAGVGKDAYLAQLQVELEQKTYRAGGGRRGWISKPDGRERPLGIPTIRDRIVQMALKLVVEPIFEADFCEHSSGFRPQRSAHEAVKAVTDGLFQGKTQVIDADLSKYFDTIPHAKLMAVVAERLADGGVLALIQPWLKAPVIEEDEQGKRRPSGGKGVVLQTWMLHDKTEFVPIDKKANHDVMHSIDLGKQIVFRASLLILVLRVKCLRSIFWVLRFPTICCSGGRWRS